LTRRLISSARSYIRLLAILPLLLAGLAHAKDCVPVGSVLLPETNAKTTVNALIKSSSSEKIVLLGEHHDNMEHHRWQLQMITGLYTLNPDLVLGFEMFPRRSQPVLDKWVAGELSQKEFLKQVKWDEYWSFDPQLYLPLFNFARMNHIPMYALNVDRSLIHQVGRQGWANVDEASKEGVSTPAPPSEGYRRMLASVFLEHGKNHGKDNSEKAIKKVLAMPAFARFVESQQVWDRAMAEGIASGRKKNPGAQFVAVLGSGHMMSHFGVPEQLADLGQPRPAVYIPWDNEFDCDYVQKGFADAVIGLKSIHLSEQQAEDKPRLGVYLGAGGKGVLIKDVVPGSIAEGLKLKKGDVIVRMAGVDIKEVSQVIDIVQATQFGTWLPITVEREEKPLDVVAKFPPQQEKSE